MFKERLAFIIVLHVKSVTGINLHNYPQQGRLEGSLAPDKIKIGVRPGPDAEIMAKEIGAVILDI